jgi:MoaD family protein
MEEIQLSCSIVLPAPLRDFAGGRSSLEATGDTVGALLREVGAEYGPLVDRILGPDGGLRSSVNVYLNEKDIRYLGGLDTAVSDGDELVLVPAIAGG